MDIVSRILKQGSRPVAEAVAEVLGKITDPAQRLREATMCVQSASELEERAGEIVSEVWLYIETHRLLTAAGHRSLEAFKREIDYENEIAMAVERSLVVGKRKSEEHGGIQRRWGRPLHEVIPDDIRPEYYSVSLLKCLHRISKICKHSDAAALLKEAIAKRLEERKARLTLPPTHTLIARDVLLAIEVLEEARRSQESSAKEQNQGMSGQKRKRDAPAKMDTNTGKQDDNARKRLAKPVREADPEPETEPPRPEQEPAQTNQRQAVPKRQATRMATHTAAQASAVIQASTVVQAGAMAQGEERAEETRVARAEPANEDEEETTEGEGEEADQSRAKERENDVARQARCACPDGVADVVIGIGSTVAGDTEAQAGVLERVRVLCGFESLCRNHLRRFAGALDLLTRVSATDLCERLNELHRSMDALAETREEHHTWFRHQGTDVWRTPVPPLLAPASATATDEFEFDAKQVFTRFTGGPDACGLDAWERWERDGTIILPGLFDHLAAAAMEIDEEFEMYAFHQSDTVGRMGWSRNMYHSGVQQLLYQDPVLYALTAAARPDKQWRLITYPYITKQASAGESTGFVHLDLNLKRARDDELGLSRVQSSVSLDDENPKGCTLVVPGFHHRFREFMHHQRFAVENSSRSATTTGMKGWYGPDERRRFGELVPVPCPALGARLSLSTIVHGSSKEGTQRRRVMFPWHTSIMADHRTVEHPDCMQWEEIARSHTTLTGPTKESLGDAPRPGVAGQRFPGALHVRSSYAISLALVGQRKWTDADVIMERNILLGPDDAWARELAGDIRAQLVETYRRRWKLMRRCEMESYGEGSFFRQEKQQGAVEVRTAAASC